MLGALLAGLVAGLGATSPPAAETAGAPPLRRSLPAPLVETPAAPWRFAPALTAGSYIAVDATTGRVLLARGDRTRRPIASLTKIMTGLLVVEAGDLDHRVLVPPAATRVEPNRDDLVARGRYRRRTLLFSALLGSNNDAAYALGSDLGAGSLQRFYGQMNAAARELGMVDTHYGSPNGLDDVHNWSSARDQALIARYALGDPVFARVVRTKYYRQKWAVPIRLKIYQNHNRMLWSYAGAIGVKTGYTRLAGSCLVVAVERGGHRVIGVLLGATNVWTDMPRLLDVALRLDGVPRP